MWLSSLLIWSVRNVTFYYTVFVLPLSVIQKHYVLLQGFCFNIERHSETLRFITRFLFWHWASFRNVTFYYTVFVLTLSVIQKHYVLLHYFCFAIERHSETLRFITRFLFWHWASFRNVTFYYTVFVLTLSVIQKRYVLLHGFCFDIERHSETLRFTTRFLFWHWASFRNITFYYTVFVLTLSVIQKRYVLLHGFCFDIERHPETLRYIIWFLFWHWASSRNVTFYYTVFVLTLSVIQKRYVLLHGFCFDMERHPEMLRFIIRVFFCHGASSRNVTFYYTFFVLTLSVIQKRYVLLHGFCFDIERHPETLRFIIRFLFWHWASFRNVTFYYTVFVWTWSVIQKRYVLLHGFCFDIERHPETLRFITRFLFWHWASFRNFTFYYSVFVLTLSVIQKRYVLLHGFCFDIERHPETLRFITLFFFWHWASSRNATFYYTFFFFDIERHPETLRFITLFLFWHWPSFRNVTFYYTVFVLTLSVIQKCYVLLHCFCFDIERHPETLRFITRFLLWHWASFRNVTFYYTVFVLTLSVIQKRYVLLHGFCFDIEHHSETLHFITRFLFWHWASSRNATFYYTVFVLTLSVIQKRYVLLHCFCLNMKRHSETLRFITRFLFWHWVSSRNVTFYYTVFVLTLSVIQKLYVLLHCFCFDIERHPETLRFITLFLFWHWASFRNFTFYYTVFVLTLSVIQKRYVLLHCFCFDIERHPETLRFITRFLLWHWASSRNVTFYYTVFVLTLSVIQKRYVLLHGFCFDIEHHSETLHFITRFLFWHWASSRNATFYYTVFVLTLSVIQKRYVLLHCFCLNMKRHSETLSFITRFLFWHWASSRNVTFYYTVFVLTLSVIQKLYVLLHCFCFDIERHPETLRFITRFLFWHWASSRNPTFYYTVFVLTLSVIQKRYVLLHVFFFWHWASSRNVTFYYTVFVLTLTIIQKRYVLLHGFCFDIERHPETLRFITLFLFWHWASSRNATFYYTVFALALSIIQKRYVLLHCFCFDIERHPETLRFLTRFLFWHWASFRNFTFYYTVFVLTLSVIQKRYVLLHGFCFDIERHPETLRFITLFLFWHWASSRNATFYYTFFFFDIERHPETLRFITLFLFWHWPSFRNVTFYYTVFVLTLSVIQKRYVLLHCFCFDIERHPETLRFITVFLLWHWASSRNVTFYYTVFVLTLSVIQKRYVLLHGFCFDIERHPETLRFITRFLFWHWASFRNVTFYYTVFVLPWSIIQKRYVLLHCFCFAMGRHSETLRFITLFLFWHWASFRNVTFYYTVFVLPWSVIQKRYVLLHGFCFAIERHSETLHFIIRFLFCHWASFRNVTFYYTVFVLTLSVIQKRYVLLHGFCFAIERHPETLRFITRFLFCHWASFRNVTFYYTVFVLTLSVIQKHYVLLHGFCFAMERHSETLRFITRFLFCHWASFRNFTFYYTVFVLPWSVIQKRYVLLHGFCFAMGRHSETLRFITLFLFWHWASFRNVTFYYTVFVLTLSVIQKRYVSLHGFCFAMERHSETLRFITLFLFCHWASFRNVTFYYTVFVLPWSVNQKRYLLLHGFCFAIERHSETLHFIIRFLFCHWASFRNVTFYYTVFVLTLSVIQKRYVLLHCFCFAIERHPETLRFITRFLFCHWASFRNVTFYYTVFVLPLSVIQKRYVLLHGFCFDIERHSETLRFITRFLFCHGASFRNVTFYYTVFVLTLSVIQKRYVLLHGFCFAMERHSETLRFIKRILILCLYIQRVYIYIWSLITINDHGRSTWLCIVCGSCLFCSFTLVCVLLLVLYLGRA